MWQVGDLNEQNGCYKMSCTQYKNMITKKRFDFGLFKLNIVHTGIIPVVNYTWAQSFNIIDINKTVIRDRVWDPLNKILLQHRKNCMFKTICRFTTKFRELSKQ